MTFTVFGYHNKKYLEQIRKWANRLDATDVTVHHDSSVSLLCEDGYICCRYQPSAQELKTRS